MNDHRSKIGGIIVVTALVVMVSVSAYAQGPESGYGAPFPGIFPGAIPGGAIGPAAWDNNRGMDTLVGGVIGGFLGYMVQNNWNPDRDRCYTDRDRERQSQWDRDHRYYNRNSLRYEDRRSTGYDPDHRYDATPWNRYTDRYGDRYPQRYPR